MTVPIVLVLGFIAFALVKWAKHKVSGILVGILFGLALASTAWGPPILHGVTSMSAVLVGTVAAAVK